MLLPKAPHNVVGRVAERIVSPSAENHVMWLRLAHKLNTLAGAAAVVARHQYTHVAIQLR